MPEMADRQNQQELLPDMDFFALDEEVARLESRISSDPHDLPCLIALAWQLRQRDCRRALQIADTCDILLKQSAEENPFWQLRLLLVRGEIAWLAAQLEQAYDYAQLVLQESEMHARLQLQADAWWLQGWVHNERGQADERDQCWRNMRSAASAIGDQTRAEFAEVALAAMMAFRSPLESEPLSRKYLDANLTQLHPALVAAVYDFLGLQVRLGNDPGRSAAYWMHSFDAACKTGQLRRAIIAAGNIGTIFSTLNDQNTALDWMERGLALARPTNWPGMIGNCLMHTASCLRHLGRLDAAQEMLQEALDTMQVLRASRNYAIALWFLGDLAIARNDYRLALDAFCRLQERADALCQFDFQTNSRRGQAQALALMGRYDEALTVARQALQIAQEQQDVQSEIETLKVLAKIYAKHKMPPPEDMQEDSAALHYLLLALKLASSIEGYIIPSDLLDEIADAHAAVGNFGRAFAYGRRANSAREKSQHVAASNRAHAMQVQHQAERARAEGEHLRQMAAEEARRAQILQDTSSTLAHLGAIGQEITAQLDLEAVFTILQRHVRSLLDASYFAIFLCDSDGRGLHSIVRQQGDVRLPPAHISPDNPYSYAAKCLREQQEILVSMSIEQENPALVEDADPTHSALFGPLTTGARMLGVMTIQSERENAYGERERLIFRNLCAYGAIALDNAHAYRQLQETQQQLVAQEKLAALGALVAGVAHELNTPLGNSLMVGSELKRLTEGLEEKLLNQTLHLSDLQNHILDAKEALDMLLRGLHSAANLVTSFKQVAVDRTSEQWRLFDLQQTLQEILATLANQVRSAGHSLSLEVSGNIMLRSYPGPLGQVLMNLVNNAMLHAYEEGKTGGKMHLRARQSKAGRVEIVFSDDGCGIAPEHVKHIFDPFFTTRLGHGGNGLGLSVCYNIVTSLLEGQVHVKSKLGEGTSFILDLPQSVAASQGKAKDDGRG